MLSPKDSLTKEVHFNSEESCHLFYSLLCQFLMKIVIVMNLVCVCVKTSAKEDDFQSLSKGEREGGGGREDVCVL